MVPIDKTFYGDYFLEWKSRKAQHSKSLPKIEVSFFKLRDFIC